LPSPIAGRFTTRDVIGIWGDLLNLGSGYTYVGNNPLTYVDPSGLQSLNIVTLTQAGFSAKEIAELLGWTIVAVTIAQGKIKSPFPKIEPKPKDKKPKARKKKRKTKRKARTRKPGQKKTGASREIKIARNEISNREIRRSH